MIIKKIKEYYTNHPLQAALILGLVFRIWSAFFNYSPMALDDYDNVIAPALRALQTNCAIEVINYRVQFLANIFYGFLYPFHVIGIKNPRILVSLGYMILGIISLTGIWGTFKLANNILSEKWRNAVTMLMAIYFLIPMIATRALLGSLSVNAIPWAFYFLTKKEQNKWDFFWSAFLFGISTILRFQNSLFVIITGLFLIYEIIIKKLRPAIIFYFITGGFFALILLGGIDIIDGKIPYSTIWNYIEYNFLTNVVSQEWGSSPWYTYLTFFLTILIPPMSLLFIYPFFRALPRLKLIAANFLGFVIFHSIIVNKLARFMIPVMPLYFILTFYGLQEFGNKKIYNIAYKAFWIINILGLLISSSARSQTNIIDAALYLRNKSIPLFIHNIDIWMHGYMGYEKTFPPKYKTMNKTYKNAIKGNRKEFYILSHENFTDKELEIYKKSGHRIIRENKFKPSFPEKMVIIQNPKFNIRRDTTYLYRFIKN